jgi:hypothetical protein
VKKKLNVEEKCVIRTFYAFLRSLCGRKPSKWAIKDTSVVPVQGRSSMKLHRNSRDRSRPELDIRREKLLNDPTLDAGGTME